MDRVVCFMICISWSKSTKPGVQYNVETFVRVYNRCSLRKRRKNMDDASVSLRAYYLHALAI